VVEGRSDDPLFHLDLFRIRAFSAGNLAGLLASISRGGLQFMLIIWLQGIWLPLHGYSFASTPLWAGIYMIPLTLGFLVAGPVSGWLSDHHGARPFATGGMLLTAASFAALMLLPIDFPYLVFAALLLLNGIGSGLFAAPNTAGIMNSVPARQRGAASGMRATFTERRVRALHRAVLLADDRRAGRAAARHPVHRPDRQRGAAGHGRAHRPPAAGGQPVRRLPRLQPDPDAARPGGP
jgi:hypothetical protein